MNHKFVLLAALAAGLLPASAMAQVSPELPASPSETPTAKTPAAEAPKPPPPPTAFAAKIAIVEFQEAVMATNEGQQALDAIQKKYAPKQAELDGRNTEIESLQKQLQNAPATMSDTERANRTRTLDTKQKQFDLDAQDARTAYQTDIQEAYGKVAQKVHGIMVDYVQKNGYTILLDVSNQQASQVMWISQEPNSDITEAVIEAYNKSTPNIAAPAPSAPAAAPRPKPATTTPHPATTPHATTPKPPSQ
jgi:Skp family chaperone for outer membrane proteins